MVDDVLDGILLVVAPLVYGFFSKSWPDHVQLAQMPSTHAVLTAAVLFRMMREVILCEMLGSLGEKLVLPVAFLLVLLQIVRLGCLIKKGILICRFREHFISTFVLYLKIGLSR